MDEGIVKGGFSINKYLLIAAISIIGVMSILVYSYYSNSKTKITINVGETSVDMELDNSQLQAVDVIKLLFKNTDRKRETQALLKEFYSVYHSKDPQLVEEMATLKGEDDLSVALRKLLEDMRGPFNRKFHKFYDVEDKSIISAIETLGFDHPVADALRDLVVEAKGPFKEVAKPMRFSVPSGNSIPAGTGASCRSNPYFRKSIRIFDQTKSRSVDIIVERPFDCPISSVSEESELIDLIQVSYSDMKKLIGQASVPKFEPGFAKYK